ncbi:hypothetical protein JTB14_032134 [Gonioctena quinquepunctata]|nr:hypothetical protein JTB14_032134 [Gonioctena quinquepunctata]
MARNSNVHILVIPPHTSHRLQPLDVAFMFPLSSYYSQGVQNWLRNNPGKVMPIDDISEIFGQAYIRAATLENALSGFNKTGIYPYDNNIFPEMAFAAAEVTDRPIPPQNDVNRGVENITPKTADDEQGPSSSDQQNVSVAQEEENSNRTSNILTKAISPRDILPIPKVGPKIVARRGRKKGSTAVITSSPKELV